MKVPSVLFVLIFFLAASAVQANQTYVVKKGDSLYKIAKKFKVDQQKVRDANNLDSMKLKPGTRLLIPSKETSGEKRSPGHEITASVNTEKANTGRVAARTVTSEPPLSVQETPYYTAAKGDTIASVARKFSLSVKDLKELNNFTRTSRLKPGQQLLVKRTGPRTYTVKKGDNIWKIAKKFNISAEELQDLNELESEDLKPGQKLILEAWSEKNDMKNYPMLSAARLSEDIKTLAESPELESIGMKERLILFARKMLNIPYRFGGSTFMGIDCSGYVQKVFGFLDVSLPRTAREQFHIGEPVSKEELSIGDLVFFRTYASFPSHVGIYLGNNLFIHASSRSRKVSIDSLDTPYYIKRFIGAKRLFEDDLDRQVNLNEQG
jgi:cell wall-associated NlpC family hydrolase